jgi:hypothetical protein
MRKYFINAYDTKWHTTENFTADTEDMAIAIVDSKWADGLRYISVICLTDESEPMTNWECKGNTCIDGKWYVVYAKFIEESYNA